MSERITDAELERAKRYPWGAEKRQYLDWVIAERAEVEELEARLIAHGICPECDAETVVDYRGGKATNQRCKCGWKALEVSDE